VEQSYRSTHSEPRHWTEVSGQLHAPVAWLPGKNPVAVEWEAGWASEPVWASCKRGRFLALPRLELWIVKALSYVVSPCEFSSTGTYRSIKLYRLSLRWFVSRLFRLRVQVVLVTGECCYRMKVMQWTSLHKYEDLLSFPLTRLPHLLLFSSASHLIILRFRLSSKCTVKVKVNLFHCQTTAPWMRLSGMELTEI